MARHFSATPGKTARSAARMTTSGDGTKAREPRSALLTGILNPIGPYLNGTALSSLSTARIRSLAKQAGVKESDLAGIVAAYKLSASIDLPADVLFALSRNGIEFNKAAIISRSREDLRKRIEVAIKKNVVSKETLFSFDDAIPILASLQIKDIPLRTLVKAYGLGIPESFLDKLEAKQIETLADLRSAGGATAVAKVLKVPAENPQVQKLVAHAQLSFIGTDVATNAALIERGYSRLSHVADSPDGIFLAKVGSVVGTDTAIHMKRVAGAQRDALQNYYTEVLTDQA